MDGILLTTVFSWLPLLTIINQCESSINYIFKPSDQIEKFGCVFDDEDLNHHLDFPAKPRFGVINPANILTFKSELDYIRFVNIVEKVYPTYGDNTFDFNSLTNYLRFYKTYKAVRTCPGYTDFPSFYHIFSMQFGPNYEPGGNIITIMKEIANKWPAAAKSGWFVTRIPIYKEEYVNELLNEISDIRYLPSHFDYHQVAAIFKYTLFLSDPLSPKYGYILLDPEIGAVRPIFFPEDQKQPIQYGNMKLKFYHNRREGGLQFITATVVDKDKSDEPMVYVYYVEKPYCSIVETTMKPNLLKQQHVMGRIQNGVDIARVTANVIGALPAPSTSSEELEFPYHNFQMAAYNNLLLAYKFPVDKRVMKSHLEESKEKVLDICKALKIKRYFGKCIRFWIGKIELLQEIWADTNFHAECQIILRALQEARRAGRPAALHAEKWFPTNELPEEDDDDGYTPTADASDLGGDSSSKGLIRRFMKYYRCRSNGFSTIRIF